MGYFGVSKSQANGQFYFGFYGNNYEQILASELYHNKQDALNGIEAVKNLAPYDWAYDRFDNPLNYRFNMSGSNHKIVARSSEGYTTRQSREHAIGVVKAEAGSAPIYDWCK